jgi:molybdenum cofactor cytidylyltransferase
MNAPASPTSPAAIILAAGASHRLGQPKQLVVYNDETLIHRSIRVATEAGASPVLVVLGANALRIREAIHFLPNIHIVENESWSEGMASSIRTGIAALHQYAPDALAALILACDQPSVTADHLRQLIAASNNGSDTVASTYADRRGIPAIFPSAIFSQLNQLTGDRGARDILQAHDLLTIPLQNGDLDIDTPFDLARLQQLR